MEAILVARRHELSELFEGVSVTVQLSPSLHDEATEHYRDVGEWLCEPGSLLHRGNPHIFPEGSMAIATEVKPIKRAEFDLDQVCLIERAASMPTTPRALFDAVLQRIREHADLATRVEVDPPAIALVYANSFRLEVVPARPDVLAPTKTGIQIVDYPADQWIPSAPQDYVDWFSDRGQVTEMMRSGPTALTASLDPPPEHTPTFRRTPLARSIQLFKRRRDRFYPRGMTTPASMVLTTLAAENYTGDALCYTALRSILDRIRTRIRLAGGLVFCQCPVHPQDVLTVGWSNAEHQMFALFIDEFISDLDRLEQARNLEEISKILSKMFGDDSVSVAMKAMAERQGKAKENGTLRHSRRAPTILVPPTFPKAKPNAPHEFFGA